MANYYAAPWGSNSNSGTSPSSPWLTFVFAVGHLTPGDTLFLRQNQDGTPGYFNEAPANDIPSGTSLNPVNIKNYPGESVWIRSPYTGDSQANVVYIGGTGQYIVADGINIDGSLGRSNQLTLDDTSNHITWRNCTFIGNRLPGDESSSTVGIDIKDGSHHNTLSNITIRGSAGNNSNYGVYCHGDDNTFESLDIYDVGMRGIQIYSGTGHIPARNIIRYCRIHDIVTAYDGRRTAIVFMGPDHQIYYNDIYNIIGPEAIGIFWFTSGLPTGTHCYNNTLFNISFEGLHVNNANATNLIKNNLVYQCNSNITGSSSATLANNITDGTNPLFVSSTNHYLQASSSAINTGTGVGLVRDIVGITVPQQTNPCIGCFEYVPVITPNPPTPTGLVATAISYSQINLAWTNNGSASLIFKIERRIGNNAFAVIATTLAGATTYSDTFVAQNTTYDYRIRAFDGTTNLFSNYSNIATATSLINFPAAPSGLAALTISANEIDLSWMNNGPATLRFSVERATNIAGPFTEINLTSAGIVVYNDTQLQASTTYYYRVRSYDSINYSLYSSIVNATTSAGSGGSGGSGGGTPLPTKVKWQVVFSKPVNGVNISQFQLTGTPAGSYIESVAKQFTGTFGTTFIITAVLGAGAGALGITLLATGNIKDKAGNVLVVPFPGQVYTVTV